MPGPRYSSKFTSSRWMEKFVPFTLAFLVLVLIVALVIIGLSLAGVTPSA